MKLRNKKTGEVGELTISFNEMTNEKRLCVKYIEDHDKDFWVEKKHYTSLAELNDEWEDYEEPKEFYNLMYDGEVNHADEEGTQEVESMKAIGNYFSSREEAERAVERLRAWKRLKDKGFEFINFPYKKICKYDARTGVGNLEYQVKYYEELESDLDLLFGGEE